MSLILETTTRSSREAQPLGRLVESLLVTHCLLRNHVTACGSPPNAGALASSWMECAIADHPCQACLAALAARGTPPRKEP